MTRNHHTVNAVLDSENAYSFTGKERDEETGYSYFGARYYDCDLSGLFLSVDPMADKYPSISPYAYCAWNPVKLVDPSGDSCVFMDESAKQTFNNTYNKINTEILDLENKGKTTGFRYCELKKMKECFDGVICSQTTFYYSSTPNVDDKGNTILNGGATYVKPSVHGVCVDVCKNSEETIVHETRHAYGYHIGEWGVDKNVVINGCYGLINYDYMDEFEAYRMENYYENWMLGSSYKEDWQIRHDIKQLYGSNAHLSRIIPEFIQYSQKKPYKQ